MSYCYLLDDPIWPPTLCEILNHNWAENPELESFTIKPVGNPVVNWIVKAADIWVVA
jgi:hypothetical protein